MRNSSIEESILDKIDKICKDNIDDTLIIASNKKINKIKSLDLHNLNVRFGALTTFYS